MKYLLIEAGEDGINKVVDLEFNTKKEFNSLIRKILEDDYGEDYFTDNREIFFDKMSEEELTNFFIKFIDCSYVASYYSQYKLYIKEPLEEIKAGNIKFNEEKPLVNINISTRNPEKWFFVDSEMEQIYKYINNNFVFADTSELNKIKRICIESTES
jgi:hypothetical protein